MQDQTVFSLRGLSSKHVNQHPNNKIAHLRSLLAVTGGTLAMQRPEWTTTESREM